MIQTRNTHIDIAENEAVADLRQDVVVAVAAAGFLKTIRDRKFNNLNTCAQVYTVELVLR
jgi:hypothetical protein